MSALDLTRVSGTYTREANLEIDILGVHPGHSNGSDPDLSLIPCRILSRMWMQTRVTKEPIARRYE